MSETTGNPDGNVLARLGRLDLCCVSDALDSLGLPGAALGLHALSHPRRIVGSVVTVDLCPAEEAPPSPRHLCTAAVDAAGPGSVIAVANHGRRDAAGWGGILSAGAARNRVEGVIVDGACRDVDESREFGLTVYAETAVPRTARRRVVERAWNVPIVMAGVPVVPGDWVIADGSGVVFVPAARADEVLEVAELLFRKERLMLAKVKEGLPMEDVMGADYETLLDRGSDDA